MGLVPGVSTIIGCCAKPGLEIWKIDQAVMSALTLPRIDGETSDSFVGRVKVDAKETARKAAEKGTAIHAAIQGFFQKEAVSAEYIPHTEGACKAMSERFSLDADCAMVEKSFAHPLGFGGKADFLCTSPDLIVDFKTKEFGPDAEMKTWDEHAMQLAAYRHGFEFPQARGAICFVSVTHPGVARVVEIPQDELLKGWKMFYSLLHYWQAKTSYTSAFDKLAA